MDVGYGPTRGRQVSALDATQGRGGGGAGAMIGLAVDADDVARGPAWIAVPAAVIDRPATITPLAELARDRSGWLAACDVVAPVVVAHAAVTLAEIEALRVRDLIVV